MLRCVVFLLDPGSLSVLSAGTQSCVSACVRACMCDMKMKAWMSHASVCVCVKCKWRTSGCCCCHNNPSHCHSETQRHHQTVGPSALYVWDGVISEKHVCCRKKAEKLSFLVSCQQQTCQTSIQSVKAGSWYTQRFSKSRLVVLPPLYKLVSLLGLNTPVCVCLNSHLTLSVGGKSGFEGCKQPRIQPSDLKAEENIAQKCYLSYPRETLKVTFCTKTTDRIHSAATVYLLNIITRVKRR